MISNAWHGLNFNLLQSRQRQRPSSRSPPTSSFSSFSSFPPLYLRPLHPHSSLQPPSATASSPPTTCPPATRSAASLTAAAAGRKANKLGPSLCLIRLIIPPPTRQPPTFRIPHILRPTQKCIIRRHRLIPRSRRPAPRTHLRRARLRALRTSSHPKQHPTGPHRRRRHPRRSTSTKRTHRPPPSTAYTKNRRPRTPRRRSPTRDGSLHEPTCYSRQRTGRLRS